MSVEILPAVLAAVEAAGLAEVSDVLDGGEYVEVEIPGHDVAGVERLLGTLPVHGLAVGEVRSTTTAAVLAVEAAGGHDGEPTPTPGGAATRGTER